MANAIQLCNAHCVGFAPATLTYIADDQGIDTANDFAILLDTKAVKICKVTQCSGGVNTAN